MCPLAEILHHEGYELSGSDMNEGETLDRIKGYGIPVFMGHAAENIKGAELVVYSAAIKETNPERQAAKELGIPCIERSVMLGIVTRRYRRRYCGFGYSTAKQPQQLCFHRCLSAAVLTVSYYRRKTSVHRRKQLCRSQRYNRL